MKIYLLTALFFLGALFSCTSIKEDKPAEKETRLTDEQLLDRVQESTFQYFWKGAEPTSGLARERIHLDGVYPENDQNVITSGGGGFGVMAILVGIERGFISREEGLKRMQKIAEFLKKADRYHGAWAHWIQGETGKTKPFSPKDDGGDIVETAYMAQGLICARQYFAKGNPEEQQLAADLDQLWREIEWSWYQNGQNVLYWHWSPQFGWEMNFAITGYNECLIAYVLGASSPTYPLSPAAYHEGWAKKGEIVTRHKKYGYDLNLSHNGAPEYGGPLFWSHYSFLGLDPRKLKDQYADYWIHNVNHVLIDRQYCIENPLKYEGYGENLWGLTASYSPHGYSAHQPSNDLGVISLTAALSSFPYSPDHSMKVLRFAHEELGEKVWGEYGPYDAFSITEKWYPQRYLAIDQGPIVAMIENHRSGLLWELFMSAEEVQQGLSRLGFSY
ncbi:MAG: glucoamylase family protein [Bacteroidia bacterium]|nr:glucoamylase family protein [Bacteroidia bacterium]